MVRGLIYFVCLGLVYSCNQNCHNDDDDLDKKAIKTWRLIEILADPGDGSGQFETVDSDRVITFYNDETFGSNGNICEMNESSDFPITGFYDNSNLTIWSPECFDSGLDMTYEINGEILIINYPCFEPCKAKFTELN